MANEFMLVEKLRTERQLALLHILTWR